ncbi:uncharacterized protein ATC70_012943 [Mucor velutinosus]|uniref:Reverse transcriptase domain-containing protein n=2 Tax=Mucor velutinosus TaxID=708070 RepID=A0AAN7DAU0_9FUNG|nr:hypothetical protein ATC70_012943 [Mucor velutinosus]
MTINTVTQSLPLSSLIFITETWLLPPLHLPTSWQQFHTYGLPVPNMRRGQMGISLLVNPDFPYPVTHIPSVSPYVLSCQVASTLIHCVYLPPTASFSDSDALAVLRDLPLHPSPSQTNTIICGDLNARHARLLGDTKTTTRGTLLYEWLLDTGLYCWNASFAFGEPTLVKQRRRRIVHHDDANVSSSASASGVVGAPVGVPDGAAAGSGVVSGVVSGGSGVLGASGVSGRGPGIGVSLDGGAVSGVTADNSDLLSDSSDDSDCTDDGEPVNDPMSYISYAAGSIIDLFIGTHGLLHPSLIVHSNMSINSDHHPVSLSFAFDSPPPVRVDHPRWMWNLSKLEDPSCSYAPLFANRIAPFHDDLVSLLPSTACPDFDALGNTLTDCIHSSLTESVGRRLPKPPGNAWFWTSDLQAAFDLREHLHTRWLRSPNPFEQCKRWGEYLAAKKAFQKAIRRRRRQSWKQFCTKMATQPLGDTTGTLKRIIRGRSLSAPFSHPEGPVAAASTMAQHLRGIYAGDSLLPNRPNAPPTPLVPHSVDECPFDADDVDYYLRKRLARRRAPGGDHIRAEMLLPIRESLVPVLYLLFQLCWRWSRTPASWRLAQVVPIYKKGDPLDPGNHRPISLTSVFRKLLERCLYDPLVSSAPALDVVQGGFRERRGAPDQALCLHELCLHHTLDYGSPPVLAFLDIKSAYDTVDRAVIWRALETYVSDAMLGLLQHLFDEVSVQVLVSGAVFDGFRPGTGVLQGSILSPFLYSVYINSLPAVLRAPFNPRVVERPPRLYNGLWINSLMYADDVVLIGTAESMPLLLARVEAHSVSLGYRWNPLKSVVLNAGVGGGATGVSPGLGAGVSLSLYGQAIPTAHSFTYLGLPFNVKGSLDTDLLLTRNSQSALGAMRGLQSLGLHSAGFSKLLSAKLYAAFIRPKLEFGLSISWFLKRHLKLLEKAQNQCLRLAFGGHRTSSVVVFRHLTNLPTMEERVDILTSKMLWRVHTQLPGDTLLMVLAPSLVSFKHRLNKLAVKNPIWDPTFAGGGADNSLALDRRGLADKIKVYRLDSLQCRLHPAPPVSPPVLLSACRPSLMVDPILYLPMSVFDRSRILRWRMGWLPARPVPCRCGAPHASRNHLLECLGVVSKLLFTDDPLGAGYLPNPLDFWLNRLPRMQPSASKLVSSRSFWSVRWPVMLQIFLDIDMICHPDAEFTGKALDLSGSAFLDWLTPVSSATSVSGTPSISSSDSAGITVAIPHLLSH